MVLNANTSSPGEEAPKLTPDDTPNMSSGSADAKTAALAESQMTPVSNTKRCVVRIPGGGRSFMAVRYPPFSMQAQDLFCEAAPIAGVPLSWATEDGLHRILQRESDGWVGRPNYTYGDRCINRYRWGEVHEELRAGRKTTKSSATGLGQLILGNVKRYYSSGAIGIGDALEEAVGMLRYLRDSYGTPAKAWDKYGVGHEGW